MPLKCLNGNEEVYAFNFSSDEDWEDLRKENSKTKALRMPCCNALVTLRTSKLGTKHFAHARIGSCTTAPEKAEHLLAKMAVVEAIKKTDWTPLPEQSGTSPSGEAWRADVLAIKGNTKIAIEIQWSRQDDAETERRQKRYAESGVRGLWLFKQKDFPVNREIPAFRLDLDPVSKTFDVKLPSARYRTGLWKNNAEEYCWGQSIPLQAFVFGTLNKKLKFAPVLGKTIPLEVHAVTIDCWRCKKQTGIVMGLKFVVSRIFRGSSDIRFSIYDKLPSRDKEIMSILNPELLKTHGIGTIKPRYSKMAGEKYLSNGCVHCDALQGRFFEHEYWHSASKAFEIDAEFKKEWATALDEVSRWWFDASNSFS